MRRGLGTGKEREDVTSCVTAWAVQGCCSPRRKTQEEESFMGKDVRCGAPRGAAHAEFQQADTSKSSTQVACHRKIICHVQATSRRGYFIPEN